MDVPEKWCKLAFHNQCVAILLNFMAKLFVMTKLDAWMKAFRLRTLALSFSVIAMGSAMAFQQGFFRLDVMLLALLTTLFLQILSNLSNDYGDAISGADHAGRVGPSRMVQSGRITPSEMKRMMVIFSLLALISGILLLMISVGDLLSWQFGLFLLLGLGAIAAAIKYTVGVKPYGYMGLGDLFVFLFFGLVGVVGTYFLHAASFNWLVVLPATAVGLLSVGVLNVNNMRDEESDRRAGKTTLIVRHGRVWGRTYHLLLVLVAVLSMVIYTVMVEGNWHNWLFLLVLPLLLRHLQAIFKTEERAALDPQLKILSLSTLLMTALFFVGLLF